MSLLNSCCNDRRPVFTPFCAARRTVSRWKCGRGWSCFRCSLGVEGGVSWNTSSRKLKKEKINYLWAKPSRFMNYLMSCWMQPEPAPGQSTLFASLLLPANLPEHDTNQITRELTWRNIEDVCTHARAHRTISSSYGNAPSPKRKRTQTSTAHSSVCGKKYKQPGNGQPPHIHLKTVLVFAAYLGQNKAPLLW